MPAYNVKMVSDLLGISPHTLRAWERRYRAIVPQRSQTGRRTYSKDELDRLQKLVFLTHRGHSIGDVASLPNEDLDRLKVTHSQADAEKGIAPLISPSRPTVSKHITNLLSALADFKLDEVSSELEWARISLSCRDFVFQIVSPLMTEVGKLITAGQLSISQEHALSAILRDQIGQILQTLQTTRGSLRRKLATRIVLATPEDDIHEFGILLSAVLFASYGISAHYLGVNLPAEALDYAVRALGANIVLLGCTSLPAEERKVPLSQFIQDLDNRLPQGVEVWVGGNMVGTPEVEMTKRKVKKFFSLEELETVLRDLTHSGFDKKLQ